MTETDTPSGVDSAPLIGITSYRQPADWGTWRAVQADLVPTAYAESVADAGGVPVLIPPLRSASAARRVVDQLDGLIIAGGADVNPVRYSAEPDPSVTVWFDDRDESELWLLGAAAEAQRPVLGICRGMQIMAVHGGGSLIQNLPDAVGTVRHGGTSSEYGLIGVTIDPGHRISGLTDAELIVPCHHHQAVDEHPGFVATGRDEDGVLQSMEATGDRFVVGVQWHPETTDDKRLFRGVVSAAYSVDRSRR